MKDNKYTADLLYIVAEPRWKWFQPPMWKCFMWAYKIHDAKVFTNIYPSSIETNCQSESCEEFEIKFDCTPYKNEKVDNAVSKMLENWKKSVNEDKQSSNNKRKIITFPCHVKDLVDVIFSHNEIVALWSNEDPWGEDTDKNHYYKQWKGMGWEIPERFTNREVIRIFGCIPESISDADTINILIK